MTKPSPSYQDFLPFIGKTVTVFHAYGTITGTLRKCPTSYALKVQLLGDHDRAHISLKAEDVRTLTPLSNDLTRAAKIILL